jgi:hypothetical protein
MTAYGFETFDANGLINLSTKDTISRIVFVEPFAANFSGTRYVPEFDDTVGTILVEFNAFLFATNDVGFMYANYGTYPSINWVQSSRTLTMTPAAGMGDPQRGTLGAGPYTVTLMVYK